MCLFLSFPIAFTTNLWYDIFRKSLLEKISEQKVTERRCVHAHPSLPPWGARLQATVEFCKQNIECRGTRRMRCSPFSRYKIRTPHPPLSWSPFSRWRRLAKKTKTSRHGGLFAQTIGRDRRPRRSEKKRLLRRKRREQAPALRCENKISRRNGSPCCPATADARPLRQRKPKPLVFAVCSRTQKKKLAPWQKNKERLLLCFHITYWWAYLP